MTTYPNMGLTLPTRGAPGSGTWGDTDDANWAKVDAHDHTSGKGLPITTASISINADLPFSSLWAPTQLHRVQFSAIAAGALAAGQRTSLFVSDGTSGLIASELYWHNSAGNKVQITAGNTLNFAAFVGGIGGDYTSVGATLNYTDAQKAYEFKEGAIDSHGWSRLRSGDLRLFPFNTTGAVFVGHAAPAGIAGSYTVTWPLALPSSTALQQIDNTGQAIFSNTVPNAVTFGAGATAAANQHITVSGTGLYKHGTRTLSVSEFGFVGNAASTAAYDYSGAGGAADSAPNFGASITLPQGCRILAIRVYIIDAVGPTKLQASLVTTTSTGTGATVASSTQSAGNGSQQTLPITGLTTVISALTAYSIAVITTTGGGLCRIRMAEVDYDLP